MAKNYRFVWGKNGFCGAKKIMAIDDVKKGKTHDEPKVSNFRVYYEPPEIFPSIGGVFLFIKTGRVPPLSHHKVASMCNEVIKILSACIL